MCDGTVSCAIFVRSFQVLPSLITREHFHFLEGLPRDCVCNLRIVPFLFGDVKWFWGGHEGRVQYETPEEGRRTELGPLRGYACDSQIWRFHLHLQFGVGVGVIWRMCYQHVGNIHRLATRRPLLSVIHS
jgi:hypothetical protein